MQGTVFWMAPEVINTQKKGYNFKIDIWSVGCVILEMWAGSRPWLGDEAIAVMFKVKYLLFALQEKKTHKVDAISFTKPNCHHRYPTVLCCLPWLMILGCNVLLCEMTHSFATSSLTNLLLLETRRSDLQRLNCENTRIYRYRRAGCSTVFQIGYDILTISISFYFPHTMIHVFLVLLRSTPFPSFASSLFLLHYMDFLIMNLIGILK